MYVAAIHILHLFRNFVPCFLRSIWRAGILSLIKYYRGTICQLRKIRRGNVAFIHSACCSSAEVTHSEIKESNRLGECILEPLRRGFVPIPPSQKMAQDSFSNSMKNLRINIRRLQTVLRNRGKGTRRHRNDGDGILNFRAYGTVKQEMTE